MVPWCLKWWIIASRGIKHVRSCNYLCCSTWKLVDNRDSCYIIMGEHACAVTAWAEDTATTSNPRLLLHIYYTSYRKFLQVSSFALNDVDVIKSGWCRLLTQEAAALAFAFIWIFSSFLFSCQPKLLRYWEHQWASWLVNTFKIWCWFFLVFYRLPLSCHLKMCGGWYDNDVDLSRVLELSWLIRLHIDLSITKRWLGLSIWKSALKGWEAGGRGLNSSHANRSYTYSSTFIPYWIIFLLFQELEILLLSDEKLDRAG